MPDRGKQAAVATLVSTAGAGALYLIRKRTVDVRLAVLGQENVGKSTLIARLMGETLPLTPQTVISKPRKETKIQIDGNRYRVHRPVDHGGSKHDWGHWKNTVEASGKVAYVISAEHLKAEDQAVSEGRPAPCTWHRIVADAEQLQRWIHPGPTKRVILVIMHRDIDPFFKELGVSGYHDHRREQLREAISLIGGDQAVTLVSGSLIDDEDATRMVHKILKI